MNINIIWLQIASSLETIRSVFYPTKVLKDVTQIVVSQSIILLVRDGFQVKFYTFFIVSKGLQCLCSIVVALCVFRIDF